MAAAESVISCPACANAMVQTLYNNYCPSCQYVIPGEGLRIATVSRQFPDTAPELANALDVLVSSVEEIGHQYQTIRFPGFPVMAVIERQWLTKLADALYAWRAQS